MTCIIIQVGPFLYANLSKDLTDVITIVIEFQGRGSGAVHSFCLGTKYDPCLDMWIHYDPQRELLSMLYKSQGLWCKAMLCQIQREFLEAPREDIVKKCIANFINRTGNSALRTKSCMVCAQEVATNDTTVMLVRNIPNPEHLVPTTKHAAHDYTSGYLLHTSAMSATTSGPEGAMCNECLTNLQKNRLLRLALANDMWIGQIPLQLTVLTLPKQVLIARYFPSAHIVKLYPHVPYEGMSPLTDLTRMKSPKWCKAMLCQIQRTFWRPPLASLSLDQELLQKKRCLISFGFEEIT
jgi:hypothetical protein